MKDSKCDMLKIVVEVPCGVRDLEEIKKHIIRVVGIDCVVYDRKTWEKKHPFDEYLDHYTLEMLLRHKKEPPVS